MTEQEWLNCTDPTPMLEFLEDSASDRKRRLFVVACCRRVLDSVANDECRKVVDVAEKYAEQLASESDRCQAFFAFQRVRQETPLLTTSVLTPLIFDSLAGRENASKDTEESDYSRAVRLITLAYRSSGLRPQRLYEEADIHHLRDIVGNPFRPITIDPRWLTSTVVDLASAIYQERAFDRMPILADALMDAGCDNEEIFGHCRGEGPHVRGCWVIDKSLGKE